MPTTSALSVASQGTHGIHDSYPAIYRCSERFGCARILTSHAKLREREWTPPPTEALALGSDKLDRAPHAKSMGDLRS